MVDSADDAVTCYLTTGLDYLIIDRWLITKESPSDGSYLPLLWLIREVMPSRMLVINGSDCGELSYSSESLFHSVFAAKSVPISKAAFEILYGEQESSHVYDRCVELGFVDPFELKTISDELYDLWQRRIVRLLPRRVASEMAPLHATF